MRESDTESETASSSTTRAPTSGATVDADVDPDTILSRIGFDADTSVLTRRQAEVLALRTQGLSQAAIATRLGTSRANVSNIEGSARRNIERARETVAFAEALHAPVQVTVDSGTDLYEAPDIVYSACDEVGVKVSRSAPELIQLISEQVSGAVIGREVTDDILISVTGDGDVRVRSV